MDSVRGQDLEQDEAYDYEAIEAPPVINGGERRMHVRAYNYWVSLLGERSLPSIEDLNPEQLEDFSPNSVLLDFSLGIENPAVVYLGSALREQCDIQGPVDRISDVPPRSLISRLTDHYLQIIANAAPVGFEAEFINQRGAEILYRGILMPFSSDDQTIDFIYGVINWKEAASQSLVDGLGEEMQAALDAPAPTYPAAPIWAEGPSATADFGEDDAILPDDEPTAPAPEPRRRKKPLALETGPDVDAAAEGDGSELDLAAYLAPDEAETGTLPVPSVDADAPRLADAESRPGAPEKAAAPEAGTEAEAGADETPLDAVEGIAGDDDVLDLVDGEPPLADPVANRHALTDDLLTDGLPVAAIPGSESKAGETTPAPDAPLPNLLGQARHSALEARESDSRSRAALYRAIGDAYDFALSGLEEPEAYAALLAEADIVAQERSPMTAVVKLVFGRDYDKTRLAEYALVLDHALGEGLPRGTLADLILVQVGGLKGMVKAIRAQRHGLCEDRPARLVRAVGRLSKALAAVPEALPFDDNGLALVVARREADGSITLVAGLSLEEKIAQKAAIAASKTL